MAQAAETRPCAAHQRHHLYLTDGAPTDGGLPLPLW
jgi:hypothetical protein